MSPLRPDAVADLVGRIRHDVDRGVLPAAQIALARGGELLLFETFGATHPATRFPLYSVSKVLTAATAWRLFGEGFIQPETPVVSLLPWFGGGGKDAITVDHLLLHTAGIPRAPLGPPDWFDPAARRAKMAAWFAETAPGTAFAYHATSSSWVIAEIAAELGCGDHRNAIHSLVTEPFALAPMLGVDPADGPIADLVQVPADVDSADFGEASDASLLRFNTSPVRALGVPGAGGFATAADVAMLYQALLHNPRGVFDGDVLRDGTKVVRVTEDDPLRGVPANRTRGLIVAGTPEGAAARGFGHRCSPETFGHDGATGQAAWADPATGLSFCFLSAALDADMVRAMRRSIGVSTRAAACIGG